MPFMLIVEDNRIIHEQIRDILAVKFPSVDVVVSEDGADVFAIVSRDKPEAVLMDIKLPAASGLKLTTDIKAAFPQVVVIIHSNYDSEEYRAAASRAGADFFISKKTDRISDLTRLLERIYA